MINHKIIKTKREQTSIEVLLHFMKDSLYQASRDLKDVKHELTNVRYHLDMEQTTPTERNEAVATSDEMK